VELQWEIQRVGVVGWISTRTETVEVSLPKLHVAVLMGGWSNERPVSLMSGEGVARALEERGHTVTRIDMDRAVALRLAEAKPDVVFNALHGVPGEDGAVQGMLDLMGLPYTHSGMVTSVIAIDKELTKQALVPHGIAMPQGTMVRTPISTAPIRCRALCPQARQRRLVGRRRHRHRRGNYGNPISAEAKGPWQEFDELLAEPYIRGRELTTAVIAGADGPWALGVTELRPSRASTISTPNTPKG
jgi:D-alanine-D-alanine ligase